MVRGCRTTVFSLLLISSAAFVYGEETKAALSKSWDDYKIIAEKNIFSRNRTKAVVITEAQRQAMSVPEQRYHTLRGITKQSDGYISFIEDSRTSSVRRYRKGDSIASGKIADVSLDNISYKLGGKTLKIELGMNLEGQATAYSQTASMSGGPMNNPGFGATGQGQGGQGQMPGGMGQLGQGAMGQMPGGMGQQGQGTMGLQGQSGGMGDQFQGRGGQGPGMNQSQATGPSGGTGQTPAATNTSQASNQAPTATQAAKAVQSSENSDDIIQRLKEKRKKELQE